MASQMNHGIVGQRWVFFQVEAALLV